MRNCIRGRSIPGNISLILHPFSLPSNPHLPPFIFWPPCLAHTHSWLPAQSQLLPRLCALWHSHLPHPWSRGCCLHAAMMPPTPVPFLTSARALLQGSPWRAPGVLHLHLVPAGTLVAYLFCTPMGTRGCLLELWCLEVAGVGAKQQRHCQAQTKLLHLFP